MSQLATALRAVDELETIQADLANVASRTDDGRRNDLVRLRRRLSAQITLIGQTAEPLFAADPDGHTEFRRCYSAMRSAAALHQADWPAIRLGEDDAGYRRSAHAVRVANQAFVAWLRARLTIRMEPNDRL